MYKLEPDDIQGMLAEAARVLTQPKDKEVMRRLISSTHAIDQKDWDRRLMAAMLGKAGKMHEAELMVHDIDVAWERADACLQMSRALHEINDDYHCRSILHVAVLEATKGQEDEGAQDRLDSSAVLLEAACFMHELGQTEQAKRAGEAILDDTRRQQFVEYLRANEPQQDSEETEDSAKSESQPA
jgi:hypothetical protein